MTMEKIFDVVTIFAIIFSMAALYTTVRKLRNRNLSRKILSAAPIFLIGFGVMLLSLLISVFFDNIVVFHHIFLAISAIIFAVASKRLFNFFQ